MRGTHGHVSDGENTESPRVLARRRRVTSKALTTSLAVVAVLLTTGGIAAPQVLYAREAANFHELAEQVNVEAEKAAALAMQAGSEELLLELRSAEVHGLPAKLTALTKQADGPLSADFKRAMGAANAELVSAIAVDEVSKGQADAAKKALVAREAEEPDPQTWFDVDSDLLAFYADITPEGVDSVDTSGTVTLERVQQTKRLHAENTKLSEGYAESVAEFSGGNEALHGALAKIQGLVTAEALRVSTVAIDELAKRDTEAEAAGLDPEAERTEEEKQLLAVATELRDRAKATLFVLDSDGKVVGYPEGAQPAEGAMRIPGGPVVQMRYIMPKLQKFVSVYEADRKAAEESEAERAAAEAAAAEAAARAEAQAIEGGAVDQGAGEQPQPGGGQSNPPVTTPPVTTPTPDPGPGAGEPGGGDLGGADGSGASGGGVS